MSREGKCAMAYVDALSDLDDFGDGSKPWADFIFDLVEIEATKPTSSLALEAVAFEMRAGHVDGDVGICVYLEPGGWTVADRTDLLVTYGLVTLKSAGANSNRLARLYEMWWDLPHRSDGAAQHITVMAAGINCHPENALSELIQLKLFFEPRRPWESTDEDDPVYAELYLNFDLSARRGWLKEKDEGYREQVVGWLTGRLDQDSR
jgi:hypothetical protein